MIKLFVTITSILFCLYTVDLSFIILNHYSVLYEGHSQIKVEKNNYQCSVFVL